jgi:hypothetical protein
LRTAIVLALVLCAFACGRAGHEPALDEVAAPAARVETPQSTAPNVRAPEAVAREPPPLSPAAAGCEAALRTLHNDAQSRDEALATFRRACAGVQREPRCRDAWVAASKAPRAKQARALVRGCRDRYCARLAAPRPRLCEPPPPSGVALDAAWAEFEHAVWRHDLGDEEAERLRNAVVRAFYEAGELWPARGGKGSAH